MKRTALFAALLLAVSSLATAQLPFVEYFSSPVLSATPEQFWTTDATLESVPEGTDGIPGPPPFGGDGYIGRSSATVTTYMSAGNVYGTSADADYTMKAWLWTPVVDTLDEPDDYWYQMLIFYRLVDADDPTYYGYGRVHAQFNEAVANRIRLQITNPAFAHTTEWVSPTNFQHSEGWHEFVVALTGTTADVYYDGDLLGSADWTTDAPQRNAGRYGFGQYIDGAGTRSIYVDNFKVWETGGVEPADQQVPPTPTPTITPIVAGSQSWNHYR